MQLIKILILLLVPILSFSQEVVLEENVLTDTINTKYGENYKNFRHLFICVGGIAGESNTGSEINYFLSRHVGFGYRYKLRINNFYAMGADFSINSKSFYLKQNNKIVPNSTIHSSERLTFNSFLLDYYNRINIGKRGNIIGKFFDVGAYTDFNYRVKHVTKDRWSVPDINNAERRKIVNSSLNYYQNIGYGLLFRAGINKYVVYFRYRLNNLFKNNFNFPELPQYVVGFQVGLY